jgi:hypothetical protein
MWQHHFGLANPNRPKRLVLGEGHYRQAQRHEDILDGVGPKARLVRRADSMPATARRSLLTVRKYADVVYQERSKGREWFVDLFAPAGNGALDMAAVMYDRDGRFIIETCLLRITQHAGQRLFERSQL